MSLYAPPLTQDEVKALSPDERTAKFAAVMDGATFYVYNAVVYRLDGMRSVVANMKKVLADEKESIPAIFRESAEGQLAYISQVIGEYELVEAQLKPFFYVDRR